MKKAPRKGSTGSPLPEQGLPPKPQSQTNAAASPLGKTPSRPSAKEALRKEDSVPLLDPGTVSSSAAPAPATQTRMITTPRAVDAPVLSAAASDASASKPGAVCCGFMRVVGLMFLAFVFGYVVRDAFWTADHQVEHLLEEKSIHDPIEFVQHATEPVMTPVMAFLNTRTDGGAPGEEIAVCPDGLFVPGPARTRMNVLIFMLLLGWAFIGVAIGADAFMMAIETITSKEMTATVEINGYKRLVTVNVWNATIANLTLMALGSSAPEILLSCIEITTSGFYAGELGPGTIVGSAAFNLLVISALCVLAIPSGKGTYIKQRGVFYITATFSVFAYVWLIVILMVTSPDVVEVWEGVVTFVLFFILLVLAFLADKDQLSCRRGGYSQMKRMISTGSHETGLAIAGRASGAVHSRAYYRVNATRAATGGTSVEGLVAKHQAAAGHRLSVSTVTPEPPIVQFVAARKAVDASDNFAELAVTRSGFLPVPFSVEYRCNDGSNVDAITGTMEFGKGQTSSYIQIELTKEDKEKKSGNAFEVHLAKPTNGAELGPVSSVAVQVTHQKAVGLFELLEQEKTVYESEGMVSLTLRRVNGASGKVSCRVATKENTAVEVYNGRGDYEPVDKELVFDEGVIEQTVTISISNDNRYENDESFYVIFSEAQGTSFSQSCNGGPSRAVSVITIKSDETTIERCDKITAALGLNVDDIVVSCSTYAEQFDDALTFSGGGILGMVMFSLALPWKLAFALAPPPRLGGGWVCFVCALILIGLLTALIGDLASHMGCCLGLSAPITAITFVALGTSLPDTFASMAAASGEEYADASIGNITGSNSVNVFLGLGLPWMIAAFYWALPHGESVTAGWHARYSGEPWYKEGMSTAFVVPAADLGFSVTVFSTCACICIFMLILRRRLFGYELGGPDGPKYATAAVFIGLWFAYIGFSISHSS